MKIYENNDEGSFSQETDNTIVFKGPENVRVAVNHWSGDLTADPSSMFLTLTVVFKNGTTLQKVDRGMKVTEVSLSASRDGVVPFVVEDEFDPDQKKAIRQIRGCELAHQLAVSSLKPEEGDTILDTIRVFNCLFASVLLKRGPPVGLYRPFDDWKHLLKTRFGFGIDQIGVKLAQEMAVKLIDDLTLHYKTNKWWDQHLGIMDIAIASYIHSFTLIVYEEFNIALEQSLVDLKNRVLNHFQTENV